MPAIASIIITALVFWNTQLQREHQHLLAVLSATEELLRERGLYIQKAASEMSRDTELLALLGLWEAAACEAHIERLAKEYHVDAVGVITRAGSRADPDLGPSPATLAHFFPPSEIDEKPVLRVLPGPKEGFWLAAGAHPPTDPSAWVVCLTFMGDELCERIEGTHGVWIAIWPDGHPEWAARSALDLTAFTEHQLSAPDQLSESVVDNGSHRPFITHLIRHPVPLRVMAVGAPAVDARTTARAVGLNAAMLGSVLLLAVGVGAALARKVAFPLEMLSRVAQKLANGKLHHRAKPMGPAELQQLVHLFNQMAAELELRTHKLQASKKQLDSEIDHVQRLNKRLQKAVETDALTQVASHAYTQARLTECITQAARTATPFSLLMVDVDHLKWINDTFGHPLGDKTLKAVARALQAAVRDTDLVGRYGGDEFCILLPGVDAEGASRCVERIQESIADTNILIDGEVRLRVVISVGAATFPEDGKDASALLAAADRVLYRRKRWRGVSNVADTPEDFEQPTGPQAEAVQTALAIAHSVDAAGALHHSQAVASRALDLAEDLELSEPTKRVLHTSALLHDIGKLILPTEGFAIGIPAAQDEPILQAAHPQLGASLLRHLGVPEPIPDIVRHHHERFDGTGRPDGLQGERIPLVARIIALADTYVTLTSSQDRSVRLTPEEAVEQIERESGHAFDPKLVARLREAVLRPSSHKPDETHSSASSPPVASAEKLSP
ncbi:MAG: bifunctional diguanylate cyclase/phosphohydrolase [Candidatus Zipacnadales bacterium]